ncbi:hypothetical protein RHMOL_Rhmol11G0265600 [Rhododendron molle]|uniref:Uncharacterized protein n=1 Tax=Rhododendron molle TaxID=49168 RepID=A0ACC0LXZ0_RHOML|nr:hypothetical protein RHMOL_Rhmol11G0265600 [Rhododendron molle]
MGFSWSFLLALLVVLVFGFDGAVKCNGGTTSVFRRAVQESVDMPLNSDVFQLPPGYNAPQQFSTKYYYEVGIDHTTRMFWFTTPPKTGPDVPYTFGLIGDLGQTFDSNKTLTHYQLNPAKGETLLFVGDLSYADGYPFHDNVRWDTWGRFTERSVAYQPWIWTAGNHEIDFAPELGVTETFKPFSHRYHTPYRAANSTSSFWYSIKRASAYIIVLSSYSAYGKYTPQYLWLQAELPKVNRSETPWLIVLMHAPWYNSNSYHYMEGETMRVQFESWFVQYKVDVVFAGHVHSYERSERYSNIAYNITNGLCTPEKNTSAPVYITIGDGGNIEGLATIFTEPQPSYSAFREASFGHGVFEIKNRTHAYFGWHRNQDGYAVEADSQWFFNRFENEGKGKQKEQKVVLVSGSLTKSLIVEINSRINRSALALQGSGSTPERTRMGFLGVSGCSALAILGLFLNAVALFCNGGTTSAFVRPVEKTVDMPLHSDVFRAPAGYNAPQQVHITQGDHVGKGMIVSWITMDEPGSSTVLYWSENSKLKNKAKGIVVTYKFYNYTSGYIHHCTITNLKVPSPLYALYLLAILDYSLSLDSGDLGQSYDSNKTLTHYALNPSKGKTVLFVGDLSYADNYPNHDNTRWDTWARFVERITAYQPWIWTAGNHELDFAPEIGETEPFKPYTHRYYVPYKASDSAAPFWYSIKRASAYIIVLSSYSAYGKYTPQYQWLEAELPKVNRKETPWLIVLMHSPWYNSYKYHYMEGETMRVMYEPWFVQFKVDVVFAGHVHAYERSERVSNVAYNIVNGICAPVRDQSAPVYITIGDGGNIEGLATEMTDPQPKYSAFREASFGHAIFDIKNRTHAYYSWHRNQDGFAVEADSLWFFNRYWHPVDDSTSVQR